MRMRPMAMLGALLALASSPFLSADDRRLKRMGKGRKGSGKHLEPAKLRKQNQPGVLRSMFTKRRTVGEFRGDRSKLTRMIGSDTRGAVLRTVAKQRRLGRPVNYRNVASAIGGTAEDVAKAIGWSPRRTDVAELVGPVLQRYAPEYPGAGLSMPGMAVVA